MLLALVAGAALRLVPSTVVPISRSVHAAFSVSIGRDIVDRWVPTDRSTARAAHASVVDALARPNATCVCQFHPRRGLTVFVAERRAAGARVIAYMQDPHRHTNRHINRSRNAAYSIRDLRAWLAENA